MKLQEENENLTTAYFSMEIGFHENIPSYAGGLGILAGDTLKSAADLNIKMVGLTLLYKDGYFKQNLDDSGIQKEISDTWDITKYLTKLSNKIELEIQGRVVVVGVWRYEIVGLNGGSVKVYFLDTSESSNKFDQDICKSLYPNDHQLMLNQEVVLGIGGVKILENLGYKEINNYHLNETHASFAILALHEKFGVNLSKSKLVFTTHTPIEVGHEKYTNEELKNTLEEKYYNLIPQNLFNNQQINMAVLCMKNAKYTNAVAQKHQQVSQNMYPEFVIDGVTNGVHANSWVSKYLNKVFDENIPDWREATMNLNRVNQIKTELISTAHSNSKSDLINYINSLSLGENLDTKIFTVGFARRAATYKRHNLVFENLAELEKIANTHGKIQFVFAGKAHPADQEGKAIIKSVIDLNDKTSKNIKIIYLPNYNINMAKKLVSGVDLWLNTPIAPLEASGTSGMKAALNGVPNFSVLDGWWVEGCIEGVTGWAIGDSFGNYKNEAVSLYQKLDKIILPMYYQDKISWQKIQQNCIALNGSYFNTHRMIVEYLTEAYIQK